MRSDMRESGENYLETIYILKLKKSEVRSVDVANELNYSKPSVSRAMGILKRGGYITIDDGTGLIEFTQEGLEKAKAIYHRHSVITEFLFSQLGVSREIAEMDACRIEHIISEETFEKMAEKRSRSK